MSDASKHLRAPPGQKAGAASPQGYRKPTKRREESKRDLLVSAEAEQDPESPHLSEGAQGVLSPRSLFKPLKVENGASIDSTPQEVAPIEIVLGDKSNRGPSRSTIQSSIEVSEVRYETMSEEEKRAHNKKTLKAKQDERKKARLAMSDNTTEVMDDLRDMLYKFLEQQVSRDTAEAKMSEFKDQIAEIKNYTVTETARMEQQKKINAELEKELTEKKELVYRLLTRLVILDREIEKRQKFLEYVDEEGLRVLESFYSSLIERRPLGDIVGAVVIKPYDYKPPLDERTVLDVHAEEESKMSPQLAEILGIDLSKANRQFAAASSRPRKGFESSNAAENKVGWAAASVPNAPQDLRVHLSPRDNTWDRSSESAGGSSRGERTSEREKSLEGRPGDRNSLNDKDNRDRTRSLISAFKKGKKDKEEKKDEKKK